MFNIANYYFQKGIYTTEDVYSFVKIGLLTKEEYDRIVGTTGDSEVDEILTSDDSVSSLN